MTLDDAYQYAEILNCTPQEIMFAGEVCRWSCVILCTIALTNSTGKPLGQERCLLTRHWRTSMLKNFGGDLAAASTDR